MKILTFISFSPTGSVHCQVDNRWADPPPEAADSVLVEQLLLFYWKNSTNYIRGRYSTSSVESQEGVNTD